MPIQNITGQGYSHSTYVIDLIDDLENLPNKSLATTVLCLEDGKVRVYDSEGEPHLFPSDSTDGVIIDSYLELNHKPHINGVLLEGQLTLEQLGIFSGITILTENNITVNGKSVPQLSSDQLTLAYNAVVAGRSCTITDMSETEHFKVVSVKVVNDKFYVRVIYEDSMILTYELDENDSVNVTYKTLRSLPTYEHVTINANQWQDATVGPFNAKVEISVSTTIGDNTLVKLYNDLPVMFATYGFVIDSVVNSTLTILSFSKPNEVIPLTISFEEE